MQHVRPTTSTGDAYNPVDELVFKALGDPTRRQILSMLASQELPAGHIAAMFPISGPSVSRHLTVLKSAGLVRERRQGNRLICSLVREPLAMSLGRFASSVLVDLAPDKKSSSGKKARDGDERKPPVTKKQGNEKKSPTGKKAKGAKKRAAEPNVEGPMATIGDELAVRAGGPRSSPELIVEGATSAQM